MLYVSLVFAHEITNVRQIRLIHVNISTHRSFVFLFPFLQIILKELLWFPPIHLSMYGCIYVRI